MLLAEAHGSHAISSACNVRPIFIMCDTFFCFTESSSMSIECTAKCKLMEVTEEEVINMLGRPTCLPSQDGRSIR